MEVSPFTPFSLRKPNLQKVTSLFSDQEKKLIFFLVENLLVEAIIELKLLFHVSKYNILGAICLF